MDLINDNFIHTFRKYSSCYTIIGGTATAIILDRSGLKPRITKDYDIVMHEEARNEEFYNVLIAFLEQGNYTMHKTGDKENLYRFITDDKNYPTMIELLCRRPYLDEKWKYPVSSFSFSKDHSLSAILLDERYYEFVVNNTEIIDEIPILNQDGLIVLKARAWFNLFMERMNNKHISRYEVSKHIADISRLVVLYDEISKIEMDDSIKDDMRQFLKLLKENMNQIPESRDYLLTRDEVFELLRDLFE